MTIREWYAKKAEAYGVCRRILDAAHAEKRDLTPEEQQEYDRAEQVMDEATEQIKKLQAEADRRAKLESVAADLEAMRQAPSGHIQMEEQAKPQNNRNILQKFRDLTSEGKSRAEVLKALSEEKNERTEASSQALRQYLINGYVSPELRSRAALQMDSDVGGGFLVAPEQFVARLVQDLDRMVWFRQYATVLPLSGAESIGVPTLETDISDTNWTTELAIGTEDSSLAFGKRRLTPHPLAKYIKVSKDLLRTAALSVESIVRERMAYKFGTVQETAFMTGNGAGQPLGVFTASNNGISTGQDVSTDNAATAFTADGLINAKYALESQYLASANLRWIMHRDAVKMARKLKDGDGQYLWNPGLASDRPDVILNVPVLVSEYAPSTFTASQYVGLIGDLSYYWIAETMSMEIQRLVELGAGTNQDYFIGRAKLDGMPVWEKAFIRVKLGT